MYVFIFYMYVNVYKYLRIYMQIYASLCILLMNMVFSLWAAAIARADQAGNICMYVLI